MTIPLLTRRGFLAGAALAAAAGAGAWFERSVRHPLAEGLLLSGFEDLPGNQYVGGVVLPEGRVFGHRVPARVHGQAVAAQRPGQVVFFARRPGTQAFVLDLATLDVSTAFTTPTGRHLAGHGLFTADGATLLTSENDYTHGRGVLGVRDAADYRVIGEIDTQGIDPHELAWLPDGRTLVVANGGILTHPRSYRQKLNIATMDPSLALFDAATGRCLEHCRLPDHLLGIRHLAVASDGTVAAGLQYEGAPEHAPSVAALYRPGGDFTLLPVPAHARPRIRGYVASIAISEPLGLIAAACPMGTGMALWRLDSGDYVDFVASAEVYGITTSVQGRLLASQRDGTALEFAAHGMTPLSLDLPRPLRWDDHWSRLDRQAVPLPPAALVA